MVMLSPNCFTQEFKVLFRDSIPLEVRLVSDGSDLPDFYSCSVNSPVCNDGLCRALILDVQWDLLGNFSGFDIPESLPLTKWDHLEFTRKDYLKLEEILGDKYSLLGKIQDANALFDPKTMRVSETVDAVTGATSASVKNAVVPGAVYSSHALWHIVNGAISDSISKRTASVFGPDLVNKFLLSDNYHYHYHALEYLFQVGFEGHFDEMIGMLRNKDTYVTRMAINRFPDSWMDKLSFVYEVTASMDHYDFYAQKFWLERLRETNLNSETLELLTTKLNRFSDKQLFDILEICDRNRSQLSRKNIRELSSLLHHDRNAIKNETYSILEILSLENKTARKIIHAYENKQNM